MEFGSFAIVALVVIAVLAPLAAVGAWHLWRGGAAFARREARSPVPAAPSKSPSESWAQLPVAVAGFDKEDRLIGASRAFRQELGARNLALDDVLRPGIAAEALFDAWTQRSGGTITPITAVATLPAHESPQGSPAAC